MRRFAAQAAMWLVVWSLAAGWGAAPRAEAATQDLSGQLAHARLTEGFWQIWVYDAERHTARQVTRSPSDKRLPAWGPDGTTLLFRTNNDELYRVNLDGSSEAPFLQDVWPATDGVWSPDGRVVVCAHLRTDLPDAMNLWLVDLQHGTHRVLTDGPGIQFNPSWSPDGRRLVFSAGQGIHTYELFLLDLEKSLPRRLTTNHHHEFLPAWSPAGELIAYSTDPAADYEIWVMEADGSHPRPLTKSPGLDSRPAWSPDGRHLAFTTNRRGFLEIWVMEADGSGQQPLIAEEVPVCDPAWR